MSRARLAVWFVVAAALAGCGGGGAAAPKACDPLADQPQPIALGKVVGVGRDAAGVVYAVDEMPAGENRLFVSDGTTLRRQPVLGGGSGTSTDGKFVLVTAGTVDMPLRIEIVTDAQGTLTIGLLRGDLPNNTKTWTIGSAGETLEVLPSTSVSAYALENLPGTIDVEYLATLADGRTMVVTRPDVDWSYHDFRVFFGTTPLRERRVINVSRGSFTNIVFDLDGAQATAFFTSSLAPGASTLTEGTETSELTVAPYGTKPGADVTFLCN
jgi:hypothetical protein